MSVTIAAAVFDPVVAARLTAPYLGRMTQAASLRPVLAGPVPRGEIGVEGFYLAHFLGALLPLTAGLVLYGWRGAAVLAGVLGSGAGAVAAWRHAGPRGRTLHWSQCMWLALLLGLMLPAHLAARPTSGAVAAWPLVPASALLLVILLWLFGGLGSGRLHPVVITYLVLVILFRSMLVPHQVLNIDHMVSGDLLRSAPADARGVRESWIGRRHNAADADFQEPAAERLTRYTSGQEVSPRRWLPLYGLLRDSLPPLEDFVVAGQPGPIGASSAIAVIIGGLFLLYRGVIDYRIPLLTCAAAYAALLVFPVPVVITDVPQWRWAVFRLPDINWSVAVTFVNYEMTASPLIFTAFFLATAPAIRPMTRRGRTIYALVLGVATAAMQLYVGVSYGPYLALLMVSLLTPALDRMFRVKPAV